MKSTHIHTYQNTYRWHEEVTIFLCTKRTSGLSPDAITRWSLYLISTEQTLYGALTAEFWWLHVVWYWTLRGWLCDEVQSSRHIKSSGSKIKQYVILFQVDVLNIWWDVRFYNWWKWNPCWLYDCWGRLRQTLQEGLQGSILNNCHSFCLSWLKVLLLVKQLLHSWSWHLSTESQRMVYTLSDLLTDSLIHTFSLTHFPHKLQFDKTT